LWVWQFWWPSPSHLTPSHSDLASAAVKAACFSADGRELVALRTDDRLSLFDATTGKEKHAWNMPAGVKQPEFSPDGRHLLAIADNKAYVLRLKPFDDHAFVLNCCEEVLRQNPQAVDALLARGRVRLHRGELDEAIADFTEVIALDEKNAAAYHGRGLARTDRGDYAGARADFAAALRLARKLDASAGRAPP
jgi:tetratricopeptide (TPR) repeat protein